MIITAHEVVQIMKENGLIQIDERIKQIDNLIKEAALAGGTSIKLDYNTTSTPLLNILRNAGYSVALYDINNTQMFFYGGNPSYWLISWYNRKQTEHKEEE